MIKKYALVSIAFLCFLVSGYGQTTDLIISEYGEGTPGNAKYVEIYNGTGASVNLSNYQLWKITNGGAWNEGTYDFTTATLADGATLVIANNSTNTPGADEYDVGFCSWNGDDAVGLAKSGVLLDVIGTNGADPGTGWSVAGTNNATVDHTLTRKSTVCSPNTNWTTSAGTNTTDSEWVVTTYGNGAANAGHTSSCSTPTPIIILSTTSITGLDYIVGSGPSVAQSYQVSGSNLTLPLGDITVTAPANFSISKTVNGTYTNTLTYSYVGNSLAASDVFVKLNAGLTIGTYGPLNITNSGGGAITQNVAVSGEVTGSNNSDIVAVAASESATIDSFINDPANLTVAQGVQVWQFTIRDGGVGLNDSDNLPTILTDFTLAQASGNSVTIWSNAIETVALFDGATRIANGTVTANQIQFTGLNVSVTDNTQKTLSLRLSLKCPLGANIFDNEDFVFSLSNANTIFSASGSGKTNFSAATSANSQNLISIVATTLAFTTQPVTTGVNSPMSDVVITAVDACGNKDVNFTGQVTLTSNGSMAPIPPPTNAVAGEVTFSGIVHNAVATNREMTASTTTSGISTATSTLFDITNTTTLNRGDLAIIAVNVNTEVFSGAQSGQDEIAFVCFQDILPGTTIYLTDNGYEREFANEWGGTEGLISITRTGSPLTKGTVIVFRSNNASGNVTNSSQFDIYTCGSLDTNWTKTAIGGGSIGGFNLNTDDDIWIMQGGTWTNDTNHHSTYTGGNVLYGWTESGWQNAPGGGSQSTRWSNIYPGLECYNTVAPTGDGFVKFNDPNNPDFSTITNGRLDWIALINDTTNWDTYANNTAYVAGGYDYLGSTTCPVMTIATTGYVNGKWVGRVDTNWFNCGNWDNLVVPDETVDVQVGDNTFNNHANIDATAPFASYYGNIAKAKNLTITGEKVEISGSTNNVLEVHGNLLINGPAGALDMDDGNTLTDDGLLYLYGNWVNGVGSAAFEEGNGTVIFTGNINQLINNTPPLPPNITEEFYNITLNNDFNTGLSNNLFMNGNLVINAGKTLTVASNNYAHVDNLVTNNGTFHIENNGSLVQVKDVNNIGNISMDRLVSIRQQDYVYWASPVAGFNVDNISSGTSAAYIYKWDATAPNPAGSEGYWVSASGETMAEGSGYIVRGDDTFDPNTPSNLNATFNNGTPNNGNVSVSVSRGANAASDDDDWNLVGNPYPSSVSSLTFLTTNTNLDGFINLWTHGALPDEAIPDPFYETNNGSNYDADDYITYNGTGTTSGPVGFNGYIAAGQSFMVNMINGPADNTQNIVFDNTMRLKDYDNSQFYRSSSLAQEKHRVWLDFGSETHGVERILVGYVTEATMARDRLYDAASITNESEQSFYSLINQDKFVIQGRALPFNDEDIIPLGFNSLASDNYTIAIAAIDGLFETENQIIYLKDNLLGFTHNLVESPYTFNSVTGRFNNRFEIVFRAEALSVYENEVTANDLSIIELKDGNVKFTVSNHLEIKTVEIIDLLGRTIYQLKGNSDTEIFDLSNLSQAAYITKVSLSNGQTLIKRTIKRK